MANPLFAAVKTYWAVRVENRAVRIDRAAKRLTAIAKEQNARAKRLRSKPSRSGESKRAGSEVFEKENGSKPSKPYDWVEQGAVNCPMWCNEETREFVFGVRWKTVRDGKSYYRRTVSVEMFEDVIRALTQLAARYANEEKMPAILRQRMKTYFLFLKRLPECVHEEIDKETTQRTLSNGVELANQAK